MTKKTKILLIIYACLLVSFIGNAQIFDDAITIKQVNNKYPNLGIRAYDGLFLGGHPHLVMQNFGGTNTNPLATPAHRLLGTIIYSGHDGERGVQVGRIAVRSLGEFSPGNHPARMDFQLGGTAACCGLVRMVINGETGNVGIGTLNPGDWKLAVKGKIRATEVKVETGWADFVFYEDYDLPTLEDVEMHIKEKGHLKDIPDAKEVEENGILLGEMNAKLLQKIEELTLYTIEQEKKIKQLKTKDKELTSLNKKLFELQARLEKLESEK